MLKNEKFNIVNTTYILPDVLSELNSTYEGFPKQSNWSDYYQDMAFYGSGERMKNLTIEKDLTYRVPTVFLGTRTMEGHYSWLMKPFLFD